MRLPPAPGRLIDIGGHRLHVYSRGAGPAVVFDAALGASSVSWTYVHPLAAQFSHASVYDRAGFGWSDGGPLPRTVSRIVDELHAAVAAAGLPRPFILVGHSYGGLSARLYTHRFPEDVAGLVLLDPADPDFWSDPSDAQRARVERAITLCRYGERAARLRMTDVMVSLISIGAFGSARACGRLVSRGVFRPSDEYVLGPAAKLPAEFQALARRFWCQPRFFEALGSQFASLSASAREIRLLPSTASEIPVTVVSQGQQPDAVQTAANMRLAARWPRGRHVVAEQSGHWIPLDEPELVATIIRDVLGASTLRDRSQVCRTAGVMGWAGAGEHPDASSRLWEPGSSSSSAAAPDREPGVCR